MSVALVKLFFNGNTSIQNNWTDEQIETLIDSGMSPIDCAIFITDATLSQYTTKPNIKVGQIQIDWQAVINGLNTLKLDLVYRKNQGAGDPTNQGGSRNRRIGGAMFTGADIPRKFSDNEFDNPPGSGI